jgi:hypothetical protein
MDVAIVVALVAGLVSLISVIANIYIAHQAKKATMLQLKLQAVISRTSEVDTLLKTYIADTERLRISIWDLLGHLNEIGLNDNFAASHEYLKNAHLAFIERAYTFETAWALVKGEMPQGIVHYVRLIRHICRSDIASAQANMKEILSILEGQSEWKPSTEAINCIKRSKSDLKVLLQKLDDLISLIKSVQENITEGLTVGLTAKPNNPSEADESSRTSPSSRILPRVVQ